MPYADYAYETGLYEVLDEAPSIDPVAVELYQQGLEAAAGIDRDVDLVEAHKCFNLAAAKGHDDARLQRFEMAEMMTSADVKRALAAARAWLKEEAAA